MSEPCPRWVGWVGMGKGWHPGCKGETPAARSRLLGEHARRLGVRDKHTILTRGGTPTVVPQESHEIAQDAAEGVETARFIQRK